MVPLKIGKHHTDWKHFKWLRTVYFAYSSESAKSLKSFLKLADRGSACTSQLLEFRSLNNKLQPQPVVVKRLSISQLFLLCIVRCFALLRYEPHLCVLLSRSVSLHPNILNASSGVVLGCWACTKLLR